MEFDQTGQHLATGDRGGRVVLFERVASQVSPPLYSPPSRAALSPFAAQCRSMHSAQALKLLYLCLQQRQAGIDQRNLSPASRLSAFEYRYLTGGEAGARCSCPVQLAALYELLLALCSPTAALWSPNVCCCL